MTSFPIIRTVVAVVVGVAGTAPSWTKDKAKLLELLIACQGQVGLLSLQQEFVLPSLTLDPNGEFGIVGILFGDVGMSMALHEFGQFLPTFLPGGGVRVPDEMKFLESGLAFGRQGTGVVVVVRGGQVIVVVVVVRGRVVVCVVGVDVATAVLEFVLVALSVISKRQSGEKERRV